MNTAAQDQQPVLPPVQQPSQSSPTPIINKEQEVAAIAKQEIVRPSMPEVAVPSELKEHGVEVVPEKLDLTLADPKLAQHAGETTPVPAFPQSGVSSAPTSEEQAKATIVKASWKDSIRYWAALWLKKFRREKSQYS